MRDLTSPARVYAQNKVWNLDAESGYHVWRSDSGDASHIAPIDQLRDFDDFIDLSRAIVSYSGAGDESAPLQNPFDISEHEFSDSRLSFSGAAFDVCIDTCDCCGGTVSDIVNFDFNKQDSIAIAKALGVTAEDLRS